MSEHLHCHRCGKQVSSGFTPDPLPDFTGLVVRAWIECPECIEAAAKATGTTPTLEIYPDIDRDVDISGGLAHGFTSVEPERNTPVDDETANELHRLHVTLRTLITWLPQSKDAPIDREEAKRLLGVLDGRRAPHLVGRYLHRFVPDEGQTESQDTDPASKEPRVALGVVLPPED